MAGCRILFESPFLQDFIMKEGREKHVISMQNGAHALEHVNLHVGIRVRMIGYYLTKKKYLYNKFCLKHDAYIFAFFTILQYVKFNMTVLNHSINLMPYVFLFFIFYKISVNA